MGRNTRPTCGADHDGRLAHDFWFSRGMRVVVWVLLALFVAGSGAFLAPRLYAAPVTYVYPPDKDIVVSRSIDPDDLSAVGSGSLITVTVDVTNNEDVEMRGFYYSDQVPDGWVVNTVSVSVNGLPITDHTYAPGYAGEIYAGFTPHRWALEMPQGEGAFFPEHPVAASGGTVQIVYTLLVSGGTGSGYSVDTMGWAGWLETTPTGTAVFGYPSVLEADFAGYPRLGLPPHTVQFTDLSVGDILTRTWDFGGQGTLTFPGPTYIYGALGEYTVTLKVEDAYGSEDTLVRPRYVRVTDVISYSYLPLTLRDYVP